MSDEKIIRLQNGVEMPIIGFGATSRGQSKFDEIEPALEFAIDHGYRLVDTAFLYRNEKNVGAAIRKKISEGVLKRDEIFVVTKLHGFFHARDQVKVGLQESLEALGLDYVDLFLIHTPMAFKRPEENDKVFMPYAVVDGKAQGEDTDYLEAWQGMEDCYKNGLVRAIGVSNFNSAQLLRVYDSAAVKPMNLQAECHAFLPEFELHELCKRLNVSMTAFAPIGSPNYSKHLEQLSRERGVMLSANFDRPNLIEDAKVMQIAEKYSKTPAQVLLRWLIQRGIAVIPGSLNQTRIGENFNIFDFKLEAEDMVTLGNLNVRKRFFTYDILKDLKYYPF